MRLTVVALLALIAIPRHMPKPSTGVALLRAHAAGATPKPATTALHAKSTPHTSWGATISRDMALLATLVALSAKRPCPSRAARPAAHSAAGRAFARNVALMATAVAGAGRSHHPASAARCRGLGAFAGNVSFAAAVVAGWVAVRTVA